jgi:hypothetical protein
VSDPHGTGVVVLRPEALALEHVGALPDERWTGRISARRFAGATIVYHVALDADTEVEVMSSERLDVGTEVAVRVTRPVPMVA